MGRFTTNTDDKRVECPHGDCEEQLPKSEWDFKKVTDHMCPNNHIFRIEGTSFDDIIVYEIDSKLLDYTNLV